MCTESEDPKPSDEVDDKDDDLMISIFLFSFDFSINFIAFLKLFFCQI